MRSIPCCVNFSSILNASLGKTFLIQKLLAFPVIPFSSLLCSNPIEGFSECHYKIKPKIVHEKVLIYPPMRPMAMASTIVRSGIGPRKQ